MHEKMSFVYINQIVKPRSTSETVLAPEKKLKLRAKSKRARMLRIVHPLHRFSNRSSFKHRGIIILYTSYIMLMISGIWSPTQVPHNRLMTLFSIVQHRILIWRPGKFRRSWMAYTIGARLMASLSTLINRKLLCLLTKQLYIEQICPL